MDGCDNCPKNKKLNPTKEQKLREKAETKLKKHEKKKGKAEIAFHEALKNDAPWAIEKKQFLDRYNKLHPKGDAMEHKLPGSYGTGKG